jgi:hypothetical protein
VYAVKTVEAAAVRTAGEMLNNQQKFETRPSESKYVDES